MQVHGTFACPTHEAVASDQLPPALSPSAADPAPAHVYDLRDASGNSDAFFAGVAQFSAEWVTRLKARAGVLLDGYSRYVRDIPSEAPRSHAEYALEFLTLGMALRDYETASAAASTWSISLGRVLVAVRRRFASTRYAIDRVRTLLSGIWLTPTHSHARHQPLRSSPTPIGRLTRLIAWLRATGEFEQEALRLINWRGYLAQLQPENCAYWMSASVELFNQFTRDAAIRLGPYTRGVESFLSGDYAHRGLREDRLFCGRQPSQYHLNMIAAEIMNQGLREVFDRATQKVVLVPACMKGKKATQCRAHIARVDITCAACDPDCAINRITRRMKALGVRVYIVPHATGFSRWLSRWQHAPDTGVAAVACMLNILPGGYEMRARDIASQCVPLDYPGCRKHWDPHGIPTAANEDRLVQLVTARQCEPGL